MKYTNKTNLPDTLFKSLSNDPYYKIGDYSGSELPGPPQIRELRHRYNDKIEIDVFDLIYPLVGNNLHYILERSGVKNALVEEQLKATCGLWTVSGSPDFYDENKVLWDYKLTSRWVLIDGVKPDWEAQLNIYKWILKQNGFNVSAMKICCIFRDWSKIQAAKVPDYPKHQVAVLKVGYWSMGETETYILNRIAKHENCKNLPDSKLPECTPEERWEKPTKYAVMKKGNKKATKLFEDEMDAIKLVEKLWKPGPKDSYEIVKRPGESIRCEYYCDVKDFCQQYQRR